MAFDRKWDTDIYKKRKQINKHPNDKVVSLINRLFKNKKKFIKKQIALDLGCGTGNNTKFLSEYGFGKVIGIDGSKAAIDIAKIFLKKNKNCKLFVSDFKKINIKKNTVNLCIDRGSITHNNKKDIKLIISEVHRVLRPKGVFISSLFSKNHYSYRNNKKRFFKKEVNSKKGLVTSFYNYKNVRDLFFNFKIQEIIHEINFYVISNKKSSMWFLVATKK